MKIIFRNFILGCTVTWILIGGAKAGIIDFPATFPAQGSNTVAANDPSLGNIWTGLAESFTAEDANVFFGFYVANSTGAAVTDSLLFSLYSGDGAFSDLLAQATAMVDLAALTSDLVRVDFSSTSLTPGDRYTVVASLPSMGLPPLGTYTDLSILYNSLSNSYAGGRFYFTGASYDQSLPAFADRDLAFNVTPAPIPESESLVLLAVGLGALALVRRYTANTEGFGGRSLLHREKCGRGEGRRENRPLVAPGNPHPASETRKTYQASA